MTFLVELGTAAVKTAAKAAAPMVKSTAAAAGPTLVNTTVEAGFKAIKLAEPVKAAIKPVEMVAKTAFEAAKPIGELGNGIHPAITARVLDSIPADARLSLLQRGFFSQRVMTGETAHAPTLSAAEMKALGNVVGIDLPEDVLENPAFAQSFSDALQNRLLTADQQNFALDKTIRKSLQDAVESHKDDGEALERLKRDAAKKIVREKMQKWRESILSDQRFKDHPEEEKEALNKVYRYEQRLLLEVDIRFTFGKNFVTNTIGSFLTDPTLV